MSHGKLPEGALGTTGGDSTTFYNLSDITTMNETFKRYLTEPTHFDNLEEENSNISFNRTFDKKEESPTSLKRGPPPEDVLEGLSFKQKRKPLLTAEQEIERLRQENFRLKLRVYSKESRRESASSEELGNIKDDLVSVFTDRIQELQRELVERDKQDELKFKREREEEQAKKVNRVNVGCQTNLDLKNVEQLLVDRIEFRNLKQLLNPILGDDFEKQIRKLHQSRQHQATPKQKPQQSLSENTNQTHNPIMKQLYYPPIVINNKQIMPDEKVLLEEIFKINGLMTTARDILKTKFNLT